MIDFLRNLFTKKPIKKYYLGCTKEELEQKQNDGYVMKYTVSLNNLSRSKAIKLIENVKLDVPSNEELLSGEWELLEHENVKCEWVLKSDLNRNDPNLIWTEEPSIPFDKN